MLLLLLLLLLTMVAVVVEEELAPFCTFLPLLFDFVLFDFVGFLDFDCGREVGGKAAAAELDAKDGGGSSGGGGGAICWWPPLPLASCRSFLLLAFLLSAKEIIGLFVRNGVVAILVATLVAVTCGHLSSSSLLPAC